MDLSRAEICADRSSVSVVDPPLLVVFVVTLRAELPALLSANHAGGSDILYLILGSNDRVNDGSRGAPGSGSWIFLNIFVAEDMNVMTSWPISVPHSADALLCWLVRE